MSPGSPAFAGDDGEVVRLARTWLGTPYVHQASVKGVGCDCLGLLRGVWRELRGEEPEDTPPYSPDWAEATRVETLYRALSRHLTEIDPAHIAPGDVALFRMLPRAPAKHCGIVGYQVTSPSRGGRNSRSEFRVEADALTLIHARQNRRVSEELLTACWRRRLAFAFRLRCANTVK